MSKSASTGWRKLPAIIPTPGTESNVKEIFDKCWELRATRDNIVIFNQFDEQGNYLWHYEVTGSAMLEVLAQAMESKDRFAGLVVTTGSGGTIASGDRLKQAYPYSKIAAGEALQCPTLLNNGFGAHRLEGIGVTSMCPGSTMFATPTWSSPLMTTTPWL